MKITYVKHYNLSDSDHSSIKKLVRMGLINFAQLDETKLINTLSNDRIVTQGQMLKILKLLSDIKDRIKAKIKEAESHDIKNMPEHSGGFSMVLRPREFMNIVVEGYSRQLKNVDEVRSILLTETKDEDEE